MCSCLRLAGLRYLISFYFLPYPESPDTQRFPPFVNFILRPFLRRFPAGGAAYAHEGIRFTHDPASPVPILRAAIVHILSRQALFLNSIRYIQINLTIIAARHRAAGPAGRVLFIYNNLLP